MTNSTEILNELKAISPLLAGLEKVNVYQVPVGYFDKLEERIASFAILNSSNQSLLNKTNAQQVPEGYFDSLSTNILAKIKKLYPETADEELQNFPMLLSLKKENVFKVPAGYFENFSETVTGKIKPATAKVIIMKSRSSWLKIAAAAVVTGAIAITSLNIFNRSSNQDNAGTQVAATSSVMPAFIKEAFQFKTEQEVDAGIAKLSDDDIIKYLEKNGNVMDNELLMKNTDVSELPSQSDYLLDENTLNSYLDKIDAESKTN